MRDGNPQRRAFLVGSAATVAAWSAPSIVTLDRVGAAVGSCGVAPIQFDWSSLPNNSTPGVVTASDGTQVTFTLLSASAAGPNNFRVRHITRGTLADMLYLEMAGGGSTDSINIRMDFDRPVKACFTVIDVDRSPSNWEDRVTVVGSLAGSAINLGAADLVLGGTGVTYIGTNQVRGRYSVGSSSSAANVDVQYPSAIDRIDITYSDTKNWTTTQFVGIHDLRWC